MSECEAVGLSNWREVMGVSMVQKLLGELCCGQASGVVERKWDEEDGSLFTPVPLSEQPSLGRAASPKRGFSPQASQRRNPAVPNLLNKYKYAPPGEVSQRENPSLHSSRQKRHRSSVVQPIMSPLRSRDRMFNGRQVRLDILREARCQPYGNTTLRFLAKPICVLLQPSTGERLRTRRSINHEYSPSGFSQAFVSAAANF
jgi:hypothetical protein